MLSLKPTKSASKKEDADSGGSWTFFLSRYLGLPEKQGMHLQGNHLPPPQNQQLY